MNYWNLKHRESPIGSKLGRERAWMNLYCQPWLNWLTVQKLQVRSTELCRSADRPATRGVRVCISVGRLQSSADRPAAVCASWPYFLSNSIPTRFRWVLEAMYMHFDDRGTSKAYRNIPYNEIHQSWRNCTKIGFKIPKRLKRQTNSIRIHVIELHVYVHQQEDHYRLRLSEIIKISPLNPNKQRYDPKAS